MAEHTNDVNLDGIKHLDQVVRDNPAMGKATIKALSRPGSAGRRPIVTMGRVHALGKNLFPRTRRFVIMSDDPVPLGGVDAAPAAVEVLLAALAGCVTSGIATNAAIFDVPIDAMSIDMEARHRLSRAPRATTSRCRNGLTEIHYTVTIQSPAPEEKVRRCKETIDRKSPVRNTLTNPVKITSKLVYKQS